MTNEQMFEMYLNFDFNKHKVSTYEDFQTFLKTLHLTKDDINTIGSGNRCFGVTYGKDFNEDTDEEWSIYFNVEVTFDVELFVSFGVSKHTDTESYSVCDIEHMYKLESVEEVIKFADCFDFNDSIVLHKGNMYSPVVRVVDGEIVGGEFIVLEDGTEVYL